MIVITGATGKLGRHVIQSLLKKVPASEVVAAVRDVGRASDLAALGVEIRHADYSEPPMLRPSPAVACQRPSPRSSQTRAPRPPAASWKALQRIWPG